MGRRDLTSIKELLPSVLGELARNSGNARALGPIWEQVAGKAIARNASPLSFDGDALVISVTSAAWIQELEPREPEIRRRLSAALGGDKRVSRLVFRLRS